MAIRRNILILNAHLRTEFWASVFFSEAAWEANLTADWLIPKSDNAGTSVAILIIRVYSPNPLGPSPLANRTEVSIPATMATICGIAETKVSFKILFVPKFSFFFFW